MLSTEETAGFRLVVSLWRTEMGFGCGCGHTNLLSSNRPVNGSPRGGGGLGAVSKNIAMSILRRGR